MSQEAIIIFVTAASRSEAEQIGTTLVEKKLIACCNVVEPIFSIFHWQDKIQRETEVLLMMKSVRERMDSIIAATKKLHSYQTPEIIALPIIAGAEDYLSWIREETS